MELLIKLHLPVNPYNRYANLYYYTSDFIVSSKTWEKWNYNFPAETEISFIHLQNGITWKDILENSIVVKNPALIAAFKLLQTIPENYNKFEAGKELRGIYNNYMQNTVFWDLRRFLLEYPVITRKVKDVIDEYAKNFHYMKDSLVKNFTDFYPSNYLKKSIEYFKIKEETSSDIKERKERVKPKEIEETAVRVRPKKIEETAVRRVRSRPKKDEEVVIVRSRSRSRESSEE